jgi:hypothetical protein
MDDDVTFEPGIIEPVPELNTGYLVTVDELVRVIETVSEACAVTFVKATPESKLEAAVELLKMEAAVCRDRFWIPLLKSPRSSQVERRSEPRGSAFAYEDDEDIPL